MIILLPFLRRFSIRTRTIIGATVATLAVLTLAVGSIADSHLIGDAVISAVVGGLFLLSALYDHRHASELRR